MHQAAVGVSHHFANSRMCRVAVWLGSVHGPDQELMLPSWNLWCVFHAEEQIFSLLGGQYHLSQLPPALQSLLAGNHSTQTGCLAVPQAAAPWDTTFTTWKWRFEEKSWLTLQVPGWKAAASGAETKASSPEKVLSRHGLVPHQSLSHSYSERAWNMWERK